MEPKNETAQKFREIEEILKIMGHDIRTPLSLAEAAFITIGKSARTDEEKFLARQGRESIKRTRSIISDLANLAKQDALAKKNLRVQHCIQNAIAVFEDAAHVKKIQIKSSGDDYFVEADPIAIEIVLRNLISNAVKFTPEGGKIEITVKNAQLVPMLCGDREKKMVAISIRDTGIGLPEEMKANLFLKKKENCRKGTDGEETTGLGLRIVEKYLALMGGKITVSSILASEPYSHEDMMKLNRHEVVIPEFKQGGTEITFSVPKAKD